MTTPSNLRIAEPLTLPCGLTLPNRLSKAAMTEQMSDSDKLPTPAQFSRTYGAWGDGGWGLVMTGNVQVDERYLGQPDDIATDATLPEEQVLDAYKSLANICRRAGTPTIVQINHPGRQSPLGAGARSFTSKTLAPSAVPLNLGPGFIAKMASCLLFGTPKELSTEEIQEIIQRFATAARLSAEAGFDGVEIHAAHGYLLAQFMSPKTNLRTDAYGGSPEARAKIVVDIINATRAVVPKTFCIGVKLNSTDHQATGQASSSPQFQDVLKQAVCIAEAGADFLEISGGSYENPMMMDGGASAPNRSEKSAAREAFFLEFAREIRAKVPNVPLMVTGGFRTRVGMEAAIAEGACDLIGVGRPAVIEPALPNKIIFNKDVVDEEAVVHARKVPTPWLLKRLAPKSLGAGVESAWYSKQLQKIGTA